VQRARRATRPRAQPFFFTSSRADDRAEHLGDPVSDHFTRAHAAGDEDAEAHRRVDVTAGDRPDAVRHGDDGEAEGAGDAEEIHGCRARAHAPHDRSSAAEEHQGESTDEFGQLSIHVAFLPLLARLHANQPAGVRHQ
jgi:hypothetical protein